MFYAEQINNMMTTKHGLGLKSGFTKILPIPNISLAQLIANTPLLTLALCTVGGFANTAMTVLANPAYTRYLNNQYTLLIYMEVLIQFNLEV